MKRLANRFCESPQQYFLPVPDAENRHAVVLTANTVYTLAIDADADLASFIFDEPVLVEFGAIDPVAFTASGNNASLKNPKDLIIPDGVTEIRFLSTTAQAGAVYFMGA